VVIANIFWVTMSVRDAFKRQERVLSHKGVTLERRGDVYNPFVATAIVFCLLLVAYFETVNYSSYKATVGGNPRYEFAAEMTNGDILVSNTDSLVYVTSTDDYVFFYNVKARESLILQAGDVKRIQLKDRTRQ
jgi:hypothetical protein